MLIPTFQRAPSKRWLVMTSVLVISLASLAWSFGRMVLRASDFEGAPARAKQTPGGSSQEDNGSRDAAISSSKSETRLTDSDNDGIPDVAELRTFQDRESFRRWFTAIAETQFYQISDQWNSDQRDCAGLVRFAIRSPAPSRSGLVSKDGRGLRHRLVRCCGFRS